MYVHAKHQLSKSIKTCPSCENTSIATHAVPILQQEMRNNLILWLPKCIMYQQLYTALACKNKTSNLWSTHRRTTLYFSLQTRHTVRSKQSISFNNN